MHLFLKNHFAGNWWMWYKMLVVFSVYSGCHIWLAFWIRAYVKQKMCFKNRIQIQIAVTNMLFILSTWRPKGKLGSVAEGSAILIWGPAEGGGGPHVAVLNFKKSHVDVYKCLPLIVGFTITVATWLREVVCCRDFILHAVATFWAMSLVGIYPGRASDLLLCCTLGIVHCPFHLLYHVSWWLNPSKKPRNYPWVYQEIY